MDIMKLKLTSKLMRSVASKLIERSIRKKFGYKVNIQLDDLDINAIDGNVVIKWTVNNLTKSWKKLCKDWAIIGSFFCFRENNILHYEK